MKTLLFILLLFSTSVYAALPEPTCANGAVYPQPNVTKSAETWYDPYTDASYPKSIRFPWSAVLNRAVIFKVRYLPPAPNSYEQIFVNVLERVSTGPDTFKYEPIFRVYTNEAKPNGRAVMAAIKSFNGPYDIELVSGPHSDGVTFGYLADAILTFRESLCDRQQTLD